MAVVQPEAFKLETETIPEQSTPAEQAGMQMLFMGLKALSQRALIALSALFTLLTVGSAFWLFMSIRDPNTMQLIECGMYALFILAANMIVRRN